MPNLVLTYRCDNHCEYCFGAAHRNPQDFTLAQVRQLLPLLKSMNAGSINIVGGEPTLNRDFLAVLRLLLEEGLQVHIFTSGRFSPHLMQELQVVQEGQFTFCVNRSAVPVPLEVVELYRRMGYKVHLSATVFQVNQCLNHLLHEIEAYHLERRYRLGIALPVWPDRRNVHVNTSDYPFIAEMLFRFIQSGVERGIKPFFDCGFPLCFFDAEQKDFFRSNAIDVVSQCGTIPDLCPDSRAIPCFPLDEFGVHVG